MQAVTGVSVQRQTEGAPGPLDAAAAACSYTAVVFTIGLTMWTTTSAEEAGLDFADLSGFTGDFPLELATKRPVAGVGDEAWSALLSGGGTQHALLVRQGDLRLLLLGGSPDGDSTDQLAQLADRVLERFAQNPPPPDPTPTAASLAPPVPRYQFGNGRALFVDPNGKTASLNAVVGTKITGRRVFFNGNVPDELDLRALSVVDVAGTTTAVLQFSAPLTVRTTYDGTAVEHRILLVLRPPNGGEAVGVAIAPDGSGQALSDPLGAAIVTGRAAVLFSGTWAVLDIPASLGVAADWTVQAVVRLDAPGGFPYGRTVTGWQLTTVPVTVGSLTGASGMTLPSAGANVPTLPSAAALGDDRSTMFAPVALPASMTAQSIVLDTSGGHRRLLVAFAAPPMAGGAFPGTTDARANVTIGLAPTGPLAPNAPVELIWTVPTPSAPSPTAVVRSQDGRVVGVVPVTVSGSVARFDLDAYTPPKPSAPPSTTSVDAVGRPHGVLGIDTIRFREEVLLGADGCICPAGQPLTDTTKLERDLLEIQLAGPAIAITRHSTGATAVGAIDARTGQFVASNPTEFWSGTLTTLGGMIGRHAQLAPARASGLAFTGDAGNPFDFLNPLGPINDRANRPGAPSASPNDPCWKIINQTVYIGQGRMLVFQGGVPRTILPPTELGFDQNKFATTWDYQQWLNGQQWPDGGCNQSAGFTKAPVATGLAVRTSRPTIGAALAAAPATVPPVAVLGDLTDTWSLNLSVTLTADITGNVLARQATPSIQLKLLGLGPIAAATTTPGTPASPGTTAAGAGPSAPPVKPAGQTHHTSRTAPVLIVVALALVALVAATIISRRRRRHPRNDV